MTRKAILIESSNVTGQSDLPGARADIQNWTKFLKSNLGGAWHDSEIVTLNKPLSTKVAEALNIPSDSYCLLAFSGHGSNGSVVLNEGSLEFPISSLRPKTARSTLIVDACRGIADPIALLANLKVAMANESIVKAVAVDALQGRSVQFCSAVEESLTILNRISRTASHRTSWDNALHSSSRGLVQMLACSRGQDSGENGSSGGYYTSLLMQSAQRWDQHSTNPGTHSTKDAHEYAAATLPPQQTPEYSPSSLAFPFAVRT
jgi:hypothetical protein